MNIALIGYRGTGKSSVGRELARRCDWRYVDADDALVQRDGRTIQQIFAEDGEEYFRDLETAVLRDLVAEDQLVLALGGGVVLRAANRRLLAACPTVWLQASAEVISERLGDDPNTSAQRPNLTAQGGLPEIERLLKERTPLYLECADFQIDTNARTLDAIADEILQLPLIGKSSGN